MKENELTEIGHCSKPHGIKGEFTFVIYEEFLEDLKVGSLFIARGKNSKSSLHKKTEQLEIEKINFGHKVMVKLKNIDKTEKNVIDFG